MAENFFYISTLPVKAFQGRYKYIHVRSSKTSMFLNALKSPN